MSEETVVIEDQPEVAEENITVDTSGLDDQEIEAAKRHGLVKADPASGDDGKADDKKSDDGKKKPDGDKADTGKADDDKSDDDKPVDPQNFEEMDDAYSKDEGKFHKKYTSNAKALYFKFKRNRQMRQEAQEMAENAVKERDFLRVKEKGYTKQLAEVTAILDKIEAGDENITTADIRKIIAFKKETEEGKEEEKADAKADDKKKNDKPDEKLQAQLAEKVKNTELLGRSKYAEFDRYIDLANEVVKADKDMAFLITKAYTDPEVDEEQLVEKIVKIARTHDDFGKPAEAKPAEGKTEKKDAKDIDRMVANAQKKKTSASLTAGSGRREISYDDLTVEDVPRLSQKQWSALPDKTRERLMRQMG